jgi:N-acetylglutamate synthase and related acetyltransferases
MFVRKANPTDLPAIAELYEKGKALLHKNGVNQWQDGYPNSNSAKADISEGISYVIESDNTVIGSACIIFGEEPTYQDIYEGSWETDSSHYGFLHRVTVSPDYAGKRLAVYLFEKAEQLAKEKQISLLRCDTHKDNISMQKTLTYNGFEKRGIIFLENGDKRLAYEKIIP